MPPKFLLRPENKASCQAPCPQQFERRNLPSESLSTFESVNRLLLIPNTCSGIVQNPLKEAAYIKLLVDVFQSKDFSDWLAGLVPEEKRCVASNMLLIPETGVGVSQCLGSDRIFRDNLLQVLKSREFSDWLSSIPIEDRRHAIGNLVSISLPARLVYHDSWGKEFVDAISLAIRAILHNGARP